MFIFGENIKVNKELLRLAIPNIVTNISVPLLGLVDLALVGRLGDAKYIGAIAIGSMIFNFLYWSFGFLRMGTSGFTAQAFGEKNSQESILTLSRALFVAFIVGISLIVLQSPIGELSFWLLEGNANVEVLAKEYYSIRIFAAPATIGLYALSGWFLGMQNSRVPMIIAISINVTNIVFNFIFVYGLDMKSAGVAWGTLVAQYLGVILAIFFLIKKYSYLFKHWNYKLVIKWQALRKFFTVNLDIFIRTFCLIIVFTYFTSQSASTDNIILAVNTLLLQFLFIFSYFMDGFAYAAEALTGRFIGEKNKVKLKEVIKLLFIWGSVISISFSLIYFIFSDTILFLLTNEKEVIEKAGEFVIWILFVPIVSFASFLWDGIYIGATASKSMRNSMIIASLLVFFPITILLNNMLGNHSLWLGLVLFMAARGIAQTILAKRAIYHKI